MKLKKDEKLFLYPWKKATWARRFNCDVNYWAWIPTFSWNNYNKTWGFEWLCFAMYIEKC